MSERDYRQYLNDIQVAIDALEDYTNGFPMGCH